MNLGTFFGMVLECQEFQNSHRFNYFKSSKNIDSQNYDEELSRNVLRCFRVSKILKKLKQDCVIISSNTWYFVASHKNNRVDIYKYFCYERDIRVR